MRHGDAPEAATSEFAATFWATPGGGVEAGESLEDALRREMLEEHSLAHLTIGEEFAIREGVFDIGGTPTRSVEHYFLCTTPTGVLDHSGMTEGERALHKESAWVDLCDKDWWREAELQPHQCKRWIIKNRQVLSELGPDGPRRRLVRQVESWADR